MYSAIEKYDKRDFTEELAGSNDKVVKCFSNIKYNQKLVDNYSCTGQAACGTISDVTDYALPLTFRKQVWSNQLKTGAVENKGDYLSNGVKQSVKLFNIENPELPFTLKYYRLSNIKDVKSLFSILNESSIITGFTGDLYSDSQDNGIIDNPDNKDGFGHAIRIVKAWYEGDIVKIKYCDNYEGVNKYNIIEVKDFLANKDFFKGGYYIRKIMK